MANQPVPSYVKKKFLPAWGSQIMNMQYEYTFGVTLQNSPPDFINCSPIKTPVAGGDPIWTVEPRAAAVGTDEMTFRQIATSNALSDLRGVVQSDDGVLYTVIEDDLYKGFPGNASSKVATAAFNYSTGNVTCTYTPDYIVFLENHPTASYIHAVDRSTDAFTTTTALGIGTYCTPCFLDDYIFICSRNQDSAPAAGPTTQRIYNSNLGAPATFSLSTDYIDAEQFPDGIVDIAVHKNHIVAFGTRSMEFFYNAGREIESPLLRNASYATNYGLIPRLGGAYAGDLNSAYTTVDESIYFVGYQSQGAVSIFELSGFRVKDVASNFVKALLADYAESSSPAAASAQMGTFNTYGDTCVILGGMYRPDSGNLNDTFCYSPKSKIWSTIQWPTVTDGVGDDWEISDYSYNHTIIMNRTVTGMQGTSGMIYTRLENSVHYFSTVPFHANMVAGPYVWASDGNNSGAETLTAIVHKDFHDFSADYDWKTISELEVVGYFDETNHTLTLSYGTDPGTATMTSAGSLTGGVLQEGTPRWWNLGRHRKFSIKLTIAADQRFVLRGYNITYNQGNV